MRTSLANLLKERARQSGLSTNAIAREAKIQQSTLYRFLHGETHEISLTTVQRLIDYFKIEVK